MIWFRPYKIEDALPMQEGENILNYLGLRFIEVGEDYLKATLPVDRRTHQPFGILHGGATCVLAETLGSVASQLVIDPQTKMTVGSMITANHLRPVSSGFVTGTALPVHLGRTKHVWDIRIENEDGKAVAKCELTCAIMDKA